MTDEEGKVLRFPGPQDAWSPADLLPALEALLFAAGEPVHERALAEALGELDPADVRDGLALLASRAEGGVRIVAVAGGWQMRTDPRFAEAIHRMRGGRPRQMSKAALETLAIVGYRQPVTRAEIDDLRGVNSGGVLKLLLDKGYVKVLGRRDEPGRPLTYGTTPLFLEMFELSDLSALPTLAEREALDDGYSESEEEEPGDDTDPWED